MTDKAFAGATNDMVACLYKTVAAAEARARTAADEVVARMKARATDAENATDIVNDAVSLAVVTQDLVLCLNAKVALADVEVTDSNALTSAGLQRLAAAEAIVEQLQQRSGDP